MMLRYCLEKLIYVQTKPLVVLWNNVSICGHYHVIIHALDSTTISDPKLEGLEGFWVEMWPFLNNR